MWLVGYYFSLVGRPPYIQVACCPVCSAIGWLAELLGVASLMTFRLPRAVLIVDREGVSEKVVKMLSTGSVC